MNIVSMGMKYLGPAVATKIASMLGIKGPLVTKLIMAALPAVLAAVSGKASTASGAGSLFNMLSNQKTSGPSDFEAALSGQDATSMASSGADMLSDLLGGKQVDALSGALDSYGGGAAGGGKSLLGMLTPAIMGSLKGAVSEGNLDAGGLADMLSGQKSNIAAAMPADFASQLGGTGLLDSLQSNLTSSASAATTAATSAVQQATPKAPGGLMKWLLPVIVIAGLGWYFLGNKAPDVPAMLDPSELSVGDVNLSDKFGSLTEGLTTSLGSITDADSAAAALPNLEQFSTELGSLGDMAGQLPEAGQGAFKGIVATALAAMKPLIENALGAAGEGSALKPILDGLLEKLTSMAG